MPTRILYISFILLWSCSNTPDETKKNDYLFKEMSEEHSGINFMNKVVEDEDHSIINYIYYYNGGGVAAGDVNGDGLPDLFFVANTGDNKLYLNKGDFKFEDVSEQAHITGNSSWNTGVTMVDINGDGLFMYVLYLVF